MAIDLDLTQPVNQVRATIGDVDGSFISDDVINWILDNNKDSVNASSIEAVRYIVSYLSKRVDEEVDEVEVKWSQMLDHYRKLLKDLQSNPAFNLINAVPIIRGGDNKPSLKIGTFSEVKCPTRRTSNPYLLEHE